MPGNASRRARFAILLAVSVFACRREAPREHAGPGPFPVGATIEGEIDAASGTMVIRSLEDGYATGPRLAALEEVPVVQDGRPGVGPANTLELVTERAETVAGGCGALDAFEGVVLVRSFYAGYQLRNVHVEIVSITPSGHDACNSVATAPEGLSRQHGLFSYGDLAQAGLPGDQAVATWRFALPDRTRFVFRGRVMADLVDEEAPTTTATPPGGLFRAAPTVTLTCADAGSGCEGTWYTTDDSEPTASSTPYAGPIALVGTTTLRFFSMDAAGNAEAPRSETYVVDGVAPEVVAVDPYDGQGDVPTTTAVTVTFSEPMDPATVPGAITLQGPTGAVAGTLAPGTGDAWVFTPSSPLSAATRYTIQVSTSAQDPAGNPLAAAHGSWFLTPTPAVAVSGAGSATYGKPSVAQDTNGDRLAVFSAATQAGAKLLYSYYDAALGTWTPEQPLLTYWIPAPPGRQIEAKVRSNGTTFLAAWRNPEDGTLQSVVFTSGQPGTVRSHLSLSDTESPTFDVAANGAGYALVGRHATNGHVYGAVYDGSSWAFVTGSVDNLFGTADLPSVAPYGANSYVAAFRYNGTAIYTSRYNASTQAWTSSALPGASGTSTMLAPAVAATGTRACAVWARTTGPVYASLSLASSTFGAASDISQGFGEPARGPLTAAANGDRFAAAWAGFGATYQYSSPSWYWDPASNLEEQTGYTNTTAVVPTGDGFVAAMSIGGAPGETWPAHVWVNKDDQVFGFHWSGQALAESWPEHAADLSASGRAGAPAQLAWVRDDGTASRVEVRSYDGSAFGSEAQVSLPGVGGSVEHVRLARTTAGDVLAVWHQDHRGGLAVFGALRRSGVWQAPVLLSTGARDPEVASDGAGFMVVYRTNLPAYPYIGPAKAVEWTSSGWGSPVTLQAGSQAILPVVASDGSTYAAAWVSASAIYAAWKGPTGWSTATDLSGSYYPASRPAIAARSGEYVVAYRQDRDSSHFVNARRATVTAGSWSWETARSYTTFSSTTAGPSLAAGPGGFAMIWGESSEPKAAFLSGGAWTSSAILPSYGSCNMARIAASDEGWLAALNCSSGLLLVAYRVGAWGTPIAAGFTPTDLALAGAGQRHKVLARGGTRSSSTIQQLDVIGGVPLAARPLAADPGGVTFTVVNDLAVIHDGADWVGAWPQQGPDRIVNQVHTRTGF